MEILLEKFRGRQKIEIHCDEKDDWFLHVNWIEKKTAKLLHTSMVIRKDLPGWLNYLGTMGWKQKALE